MSSQTWLLRVAASTALLAALAGAAVAGKITVDPNTGGKAPAAALASADRRLAQKVTYDARHRAVRLILADLCEMTGVKFIAGASKNDWPVRDRKMNVFVKDTKLADVMNSIARVMKFRWSASEELDPPVYRLIVDRKAALAADAMMKHADEIKTAAWRARRQEWLDVIDRHGTKSQSEIELLRESEPVIFRNGRYGALKALRALFAEFPEARERYLAGRGFRISNTKLSDETRDLLYSAGSEFWRYLQDIKYVGGEPIGYGDSLKPTDKCDVVYYRLDQDDSFTPGRRWWGCERSTGVVAFMGGSWDKSIADLNVISDPWANYKCARQDAMWDAKGMVPWDESQRAKLDEDLKNEEEALYPSEPLDEHPEFPELEDAIKLKIESSEAQKNPALAVNDYVASFQKALADVTGIGVVSDSWVSISGDKLPDEEAKLGDLLNKFAARFNYNWDKPSAILEFRHRKWRKNRLNQISDDQLAAWSENTRKNGVLSLDDLARISTLVYDQAEESLKGDQVLGATGLYDGILGILDRNGNLYWLRLYASLTPSLRRLLTEGSGVNGFMLTQDQWKLAQTMFDRIGSSRGDALFRLERVPDATDQVYTFREIDTDSGEEDRMWTVRLPRYTPPPDKQEKK